MKKSLLAGVALSFVMSTAAYADILIATAGPMTGQYASFGAQMKAGAEQAVEDINAAGGINGEMLKLEIGEDIDWTAFSVWLSALIHARGDDILRVKGVVRTPAGRLLLHSVRKIVQSPEILPDDRPLGDDNGLVFIGRGFGTDQLARSLRHFAGLRE